MVLSSNHCFDFCQHRLVVPVPFLNFIEVKSHCRPYFYVWVILLDIIFLTFVHVLNILVVCSFLLLTGIPFYNYSEFIYSFTSY